MLPDVVMRQEKIRLLNSVNLRVQKQQTDKEGKSGESMDNKTACTNGKASPLHNQFDQDGRYLCFQSVRIYTLMISSELGVLRAIEKKIGAQLMNSDHN
jgi:hypothetical protein